MMDKRERIAAIGQKLDITETELVMLENTQRRKKHFYRILAGIEALIGLFSFMGGWVIGYDAANSGSYTGYPFSIILMSGSMSSFSKLRKRKDLLLLPVITFLIIVLGLTSGVMFGSAAAPIPTGIKYNVYLKK